MSASHRQYTEAFRQEAVKLSRQAGYGLRKAAGELGVPWKTLRNWRKAQGTSPPVARGRPVEAGADPAALQARIRELEQQLARSELEKEILKKATAYFAKEHL